MTPLSPAVPAAAAAGCCSERRSAGVAAWTDLIAILLDFSATIERVNGMALIGTCLAEEAHTPELLALLRGRTVLPRRALLREALERARDAGEFEAEDLEPLVSALLGPFYADYMAGRSGDPDWAARAVDLVLTGLPGAATGRRRAPLPDGR